MLIKPFYRSKSQHEELFQQHVAELSALTIPALCLQPLCGTADFSGDGRGRIGIFNRSYYEEVLIVRVHPEILLGQRLPDGVLDKKTIWQGVSDFLCVRREETFPR